MQRSFSTFAPGWAGVGLLVLRTALAVPLFLEGAERLADWRDANRLPIVCALISVATGLALQLGYSVGLGAIVGGLSVVALHCCPLHGERLNLFSSRIACFLAISIAIALFFLGPGAFSIDARRFGRRHIVIPPRSMPD